MTFPFLHPSLLGVALLVGLTLWAVLSPSRWRMVAVVAGGVLAAVVAALAGWIPWLGTLHLSAYGIALLVAVIAGYVVILPRARAIGVAERQVIDVVMLALVAGLLGARLFEVIDHWPEYAAPGGKPAGWGAFLARAADIDGGGMVWYGGALVGTAAVVIYAWRCRIPVLQLADVMLPGMLVGVAIGRIGCFFNGCCYGRVCDLPWAVVARGDHGVVAARHPTQLYETVACAVLAGMTWWWWRRRRSDGEVALMAVIGYALWRFGEEFLREDKVMVRMWGVFPLSTAQVISVHLMLVTLVVVGVVVWYRQRRSRQEEGDPGAGTPP